MSEKLFSRFSLARSAVWVLLMVPSYFLGWIYSVAFVAICSLYANAAADFASWRSDQNKGIVNRLQAIEEKLDNLLKEGNA